MAYTNLPVKKFTQTLVIVNSPAYAAAHDSKASCESAVSLVFFFYTLCQSNLEAAGKPSGVKLTKTSISHGRMKWVFWTTLLSSALKHLHFVSSKRQYQACNPLPTFQWFPSVCCSPHVLISLCMIGQFQVLWTLILWISSIYFSMQNSSAGGTPDVRCNTCNAC